MLGVRTGYRTWGFFWIPRSTSAWSAICTKVQTMWNIESWHHISQHQPFSLKPGPQHIRGKKYLWVWQLELLVFWRPGKENYKKFSTLSLWTKKTPYLRYPLWGNKAGGLDHWQACFGKHVYQLDFLSRRNNFLKHNETKNSLNWLWWEVRTQRTLFPPPVTSAISICVRNFCNQWHHRGSDRKVVKQGQIK